MKYEFIAKNKVNGMFRFLMKDTDSNMLNQVFIYEKDNEEILQNYIYDFLIRNNNQIDYVEKKYSIMVKTPFSNIAFSFYNIPKSFIDFFYFIYAPVIVFNVNCDYEVELLFQDNNFFEIKSEYMSSCDLIYRVMLFTFVFVELYQKMLLLINVLFYTQVLLRQLIIILL